MSFGPAQGFGAALGVGGAASSANPFVTIGAIPPLSNERSLTGTSNQLIVTDNGPNSTVVLSTPQNTNTAATPTFSRLTLDIAIGTSPLVITSTTIVANLNADLIDGTEEAALMLIAGTRAFTGTVSGVTPTQDLHLATKAYVDSTGVTDHGALTGLNDDDHSAIYVRHDGVGRAGGSSIVGGTAASEDLTLRATSSATDGDIIFESDPTTERMRITSTGKVGIGNSAPGSTELIVTDNSNSGTFIAAANSTDGSAVRVGFTCVGGSGSGEWHVTAPTFTPASQRAADTVHLETSATVSGGLRTIIRTGPKSVFTGAVEREHITQTGEHGIGDFTSNAPGVTGTTNGVGSLLHMTNAGTVPTGTLTAGGALLYATTGELHVLDAAGNDTLLSPHDPETNEWIYHSKDKHGRVLNIRVEAMMVELEKMFGWGFIERHSA